MAKKFAELRAKLAPDAQARAAAHAEAMRDEMKPEYDFSAMKARQNPYASKLNQSVTLRLPEDVVEYFKRMALDVGIPYQSLINLYLRDCAASNRKIKLNWK